MTDQTAVAAQPEETKAQSKEVARLVVHHDLIMMDTAKFEQVQRAARVLSYSSLIPASIRGSTPEEGVANLVLITDQAMEWGLKPSFVAQNSSIIHGKWCLEGKVVNAVLNSDPKMVKPLEYEFSGEGANRKIVITGFLKSNPERALVVEGTVAKWRTSNKNWDDEPDSMLVYRGGRVWGNRYNPQRLGGAYMVDEIEEDPAGMKNITPAPSRPPAIPQDEPETEPATEDQKPAQTKKTPPPIDRENAEEAVSGETKTSSDETKTAETEKEAVESDNTSAEQGSDVKADTAEPKAKQEEKQPAKQDKALPQVDVEPFPGLTMDMVKRAFERAVDMDELNVKKARVDVSTTDWNEKDLAQVAKLYEEHTERLQAL